MSKLDVAGLKIDAISKSDLLAILLERIKANQKTWITTVYSEFLYAGLRDPQIIELLNKADVAVADGIGIFWAKKYLEIPLQRKNYWLMILQALWQIIYSLAAIVFNRRWIASALPEKIVGADLIWDLAKFASENNFSIYLLGGHGDTPKMVANQLISKSVDQLRIAGWSNKNPNDPTLYEDIQKASPDLLFVAYGPIKQEAWIASNMPNLPVKLAIGVGGTFDYLAGRRLNPPKFLRYAGLEWLWRLITQPHRISRIINATFGLSWLLWHYKVFNHLPLRPNVAVAILNKENKILVCQRNPKNFYVDVISTKQNLKSQNYWQLPQGGVDSDEDLVAAAKREAAEETGLQNLELIKISNQTHNYIWNNALRGFWHNQSKPNIGQTQQIVYLRFLGANDEVKVDDEEFINFKWADVNQLEKIVHPERIGLIKIVRDDLRDLA